MQKKTIQSIAGNLHSFKQEKDFYQVWINFCRNKNYLNKFKLRGFESGELNIKEGPDFQGAEFELNGKIYRGDVEIHKECIDWKAHGHHLDPRYDKVVLHLVASQNLVEVFNSKNQRIPSISLLNFDYLNNHSCQKNCQKEVQNSTKLQKVALMRMINKSHQTEDTISNCGIDQALYALIIKSLGNVTNKNNYERLSQIIPWKLVYILKSNNYPFSFWKALYLGAAGFLDETSESEITHWNQCQSLIEGNMIKKETWRKGGVRPCNYPQNRLIGLALFVYHLNQPSIFNPLKELFYSRDSVKELIVETEKIFVYRYHGKIYWGKNLVLEIIGNILLPFFYNYAVQNNSHGFQMYLQQCFLDLPATQHYSKLKQLTNTFKNCKTDTKYFYFNQAMLYLYHNFCTTSNFNNCLLKTIQQKN